MLAATIQPQAEYAAVVRSNLVALRRSGATPHAHVRIAELLAGKEVVKKIVVPENW